MVKRNIGRLLRNNPTEPFLGKGLLKVCSQFIPEHPCRSVISINLLCSFIQIVLWRKCSPVNLWNISRTIRGSSNQCLLEQINIEYISWLQYFLNQPLYDKKYLLYVHISLKLFWPIWNAASSLSITPQLGIISIAQNKKFKYVTF